MKKILSVLAILAMAVLLVACSHDGTNTSSNESSSSTSSSSVSHEMDGIYYFYSEDNLGKEINKGVYLKVDGDRFVLHHAGIHKGKILDDEEVMKVTDNTMSNKRIYYSYDKDLEVIELSQSSGEGDHYVKEDSDKYNELIKNGAKVIEVND
ncbi:hypothetical protein [Streptococcus sobrinus]|uniref:hypothetical protein n=1 Tax=Streptococcus sobrinus TaxID=1310 RepID=UPI00035E7C39|nr:hypothetical protein [Streptococcus sobrinus]